MKQKLPWCLGMIAFAFLGYSIAAKGHEQLPTEPEITPETITFYWTQPNNPGLSKLLSFGCALMTAYCFYQMISEDNDGLVKVPTSVGTRRSTRSVTSPAKVEYQQENFNQGSSFVMPSPGGWTEDDEPIQIEAAKQKQEVSARNPLDVALNSRKKHLFCASETGMGKTTLQHGLMHRAVELFGADGVEFFGATAKLSAWAGLEEEQSTDLGDGLPRILEISQKNPESLFDLVTRLEFLVKRMEMRQEKRASAERDGRSVKFKPNYIILDEWWRIMLLAKSYDKRNKANVAEQLVSLLTDFVIVGREDNMIVWIFAQSHLVKNIDLDTGLQQNLNTMVLGAPDALSSISHALFDPGALISNRAIKDSLWEQCQEFASEGKFMTLWDTDSSALAMPDLEGIKFKKLPRNKNSKVVSIASKQTHPLPAVDPLLAQELESDVWG